MKIVVLTIVQQYQQGTHIFIIPKKEGTASFITYYHRLNQQLVRKTYTFPRMGEIMQQMEEFHYATTLYLNIKILYYKALNR